MFSYRYGAGHVARMVVVVLVVLSVPLFAEPTGTFTDDRPAETGENLPVEGENLSATGIAPEPSMPAAPIIYPDAVTLGEIENRLRRELLDDRSRALDRWLAVVAIVLTFFAVIIAILGIFGFKRFREIETEARRHETEARRHVDSSKEHADEAQRLVKQIKGKHAEAEAKVEDIGAFENKKIMIAEMIAEGISNDPKKAEQVAKNVQENPEASLVDKAIAAAGILQQQGKIDEAIEKWRSIANIMAEADKELAARAWFSVGYLYGNKKRGFKAAINASTKAIELKPDLAEAYNNRGIAKRNLGKYEEAIADYDQAIFLKPDDALAYYNRGVAKDKLGKHEEAIEDYDQAIHRKPDLAEAYNNRGTAKNSLGRHEGAIADYDQAIRLNPDLAETYVSRGNAKGDLRRHVEAIADYDEAIRLNPDFAEAYYNRGVENKAWGRMDEARKDWKKVLDLVSDGNLATKIRKAIEDIDEINSWTIEKGG